MRRTLVFALTAAATTSLVLLRLEEGLELLAWEGILLAILFILFRIFPRAEWDEAVPLFGVKQEEPPRPPRSVSSFELAAMHAFSESPGADQRLRVMMRRIANHRLAKKNIAPGTQSASRLVDDSLFRDTDDPLTAAHLERIVQQLENL
ncbi:MAG TPA: hypothetical protein VE569_02225 [Acidimicrobiia bacterium]|nr:hypothetical protein [Acidimicrobiia bacterium]